MNVIYVVMAAGESARFGDCKLLAELRGRPLIDYALDAIREESVYHQPVMISGAYHDELVKYLTISDQNDIRVLHNTNWKKGLGESLSFCSRQLPADAHLCIMLADQFDVRADDLNRLVNKARFHPKQVVCAEFTKTYGPPVVFPPQWRDDLDHLSGEKGAKSLITTAGDQLISVELIRAQSDIDTREELENVNN